MTNKTTGREIFWKVAVAVLIVIVGFQTALMYLSVNKKETLPTEQVPDGDAIIRPRVSLPNQYSSPSSMQNPANTGQNQILRPPPLPKVNLNLNNMPGIRPQPPPATQAQSQIMPPQLSPMGMQQRMAGMSGHSAMNIQDEFERMQRLMDQMFSDHDMSAAMDRHSRSRGLSMRVAAPRLTEDGNNYVVKLTIPGLDAKGVNASVRNNILTLSGVQTEETENNSQYGRSYSSSTSSFQNSFSLPGPIKSEGLKVNYENDTLTVVIPKA